MLNFKISIIVPCFNEQDVIKQTYARLTEAAKKNKYTYEIIFINDGSIDETLNLLEAIARHDKNVKIISFSRNFGHQPAVSAGITTCSGDVAVIIDADLQDPPEVLPEMIKIYFKEKCNIVYGVRKKRKKEGFFKKITAKIFYRLINYLSEAKFPVDTGDFRLIDKKVINAYKKLNEKNKYIRGLISWMGFKQSPIFYDRDPRLLGETKYTLKKMLKFAKTGIFYFSTKPLKIAFSLGVLSILAGFGLLAYVLISKFIFPSTTIPGWASILTIIIFFSGIQLLITGILGEYIGIIFEEVKNRPEFIIDKKINFIDDYSWKKDFKKRPRAKYLKYKR
jgi:glycosyltransferase involved in cell wall biosynthesis